ncbi:hypothetical protein ACHAWF_014327, partial [Thalassiosira exigua]
MTFFLRICEAASAWTLQGFISLICSHPSVHRSRRYIAGKVVWVSSIVANLRPTRKTTKSTHALVDQVLDFGYGLDQELLLLGLEGLLCRLDVRSVLALQLRQLRLHLVELLKDIVVRLEQEVLLLVHQRLLLRLHILSL